jgi:hypothetical protein
VIICSFTLAAIMFFGFSARAKLVDNKINNFRDVKKVLK